MIVIEYVRYSILHSHSDVLLEAINPLNINSTPYSDLSNHYLQCDDIIYFYSDSDDRSGILIEMHSHGRYRSSDAVYKNWRKIQLCHCP